MPKYWSGRALPEQMAQAAAPPAGARQQHQPSQCRPSFYARAYDGQAEAIALNHTQRVTLARWVDRAHPELPWGEAYGFSLTTGSPRSAAEVYAGTGKER
ncbi:hypothetical protein [Streptomyces decoyicus]|uniref:hypothetical protein n=1 Tax=Streptomyces decoyicus TaxID=249567 RepID=UPI003657A940